jgi:hypothetical protein
MKYSKHVWFALFAVICLIWIPASNARVQLSGPQPASSPGLMTPVKLPLHIIENRGQLPGDFLFHIKCAQGQVLFAQDGMTFQFLEGKKTVDVSNLRLRFLGARDEARPEGVERNQGLFNFYRGADPDKWVTGAGSFKEVLYSELYPGVNLRVYADGGVLKNEYCVRPGGDADSIALRYEGAERLTVDESGRLAVDCGGGRILYEDAPVTFQVIDGRTVPIDSAYVVTDDGILSYRVGDYDRGRELVIDPSLLYSTYLGGSGLEFAGGIAVDLKLNAYATGETLSSNFPTTPGALPPQLGYADAYVACLNPTGTSLVYATFIGGTSDDSADDITFSWGDNSAVISGTTKSSDFPVTATAFDKTLSGIQDFFITKLTPKGTIKASTYFGGSSGEYTPRISRDGQGHIYLMGITCSSDMNTTPGCFDSTFNQGVWAFSPDNTVVAKFKNNLNGLLYSTFFGGGGMGTGAIVADYAGYAYIVGSDLGLSVPITAGTFGENYSGEIGDGYIGKLNPSGTAVEYASWLQINGGELNHGQWGARDIDVDANGNTYVAYFTATNFFDLPIPPEPGQAGIKKINADCTQVIWDKKIGGSERDEAWSVAVDGRGGVYLYGSSRSNDFETTDDALQSSFAGQTDLFLAKFKASNGNILYSTLLGGSDQDMPRAMVVDSFGAAYLTGHTLSYDFPTTPGAVSTALKGELDSFVVRVRDAKATGAMAFNKKKLSFQFAKGSTASRTKNLFLSNEGKGVVAYEVDSSQKWLTVTPNSGEVRNETDKIQVTVSAKGLMSGTHYGSVMAASADAFNSPQQVTVKLKIKGPRIKIQKKNFNLTAEAGGADPLPATIKIRNTGTGTLRFRLTPHASWLKLSRKQGKSTGKWVSIKMTIDITGLTPGIYSDIIEVASQDTINTDSIQVTLTVKAPACL